MEKKNKRKSLGRWTSLVLTFMFIGSWAVLGVALALASKTVTIGGNVSFSNDHIYATVTATGLTGGTGFDSTNDCKTLVFAGKTEASSEDVGTWTGLDFNFNEVKDDGTVDTMTFVFTIDNTATSDKTLYVTISDNFGDITPNNASCEISVTGSTLTSGEYRLGKDDTLTVTVTFKVADASNGASINGWSVNVGLYSESRAS